MVMEACEGRTFFSIKAMRKGKLLCRNGTIQMKNG